MLPLSDYDMDDQNMDEYDDMASFCPGVTKAQAEGWLMERSTYEEHMNRRTQSPEVFLTAARSDTARSPSPDQWRLGTPTANGIPQPFQRQTSSSPSRCPSAEAGLEVAGRNMGLRLRSSSPELNIATSAGAAVAADHPGERMGSKSGFAAALGLTCPRSSGDLQEAPGAEIYRPRARSPLSRSSRPNSAQILRKAKSTITARPRSAALPSIQRMQRAAPSEAALLKEAQRLLAAPANPTAQLKRSSSAPGVRGGRGLH